MEDNLRRLKQKLTILELEGANQLLFDLLDLVSEINDEQELSQESKLLYISTLKTRYKQWEEALTPKNPSQGKLFIVK